MDEFQRYAIYAAPQPGALADFGAAWLGWDAARGCEAPTPVIPGLPRPAGELSATPRKYGFHGTLKPPFRLAEAKSERDLDDAAAGLARRCAPVTLDGLRLERIGSFLALIPEGDGTGLARLAAAAVVDLDAFRAPPSEADVARRQAHGLSTGQEALLARWGYPYVLEEFRFHMTLTGAFDPATLAATETALRPVLSPLLPRPFTIADLCLFGEAQDGRFHILHRYPLSG